MTGSNNARIFELYPLKSPSGIAVIIARTYALINLPILAAKCCIKVEPLYPFFNISRKLSHTLIGDGTSVSEISPIDVV